MDVILDDRLLVEELLVGLDRRGAQLHTTTYWYYRACRAAVLGAGGYLLGPFQGLDEAKQFRAVSAMLQLTDDIGLPQARVVVPLMVDIATRHPQLNLLNLEAVAVAQVLRATVWLSPKGSSGILPGVFSVEGVSWETVAPS